MTRYQTLHLPLAAAALLGAASPAQAQRCTALAATGVGSVTQLCACTTVTPGFLRGIARKPAFPALLARAETACPGMARLLSDMPTAAPRAPVRNPPSDDGGAVLAIVTRPNLQDDPEEDAPGLDTCDDEGGCLEAQ